MILSKAAAHVMGLSQDGAVADALAVAERGLETAPGASPSDQAALWYAISVARHIDGTTHRALHACEQCLALAVESDNPGWASYGLSMRGMAAARQGRMEPALLDLARAETELERCDDDGLLCWAHTGLGYTYLELRLYELALPHMLVAQELDASPIPLALAPVIDLMNLAELHLRWADELERVFPYDLAEEDIEAHRKEGHEYAERALAVALEKDNPRFVATCRAMELCARPRGSGASLRSCARRSRPRTIPTTPGAGPWSGAHSRGPCGSSAGVTRPRRWPDGRRRSPSRPATGRSPRAPSGCSWRWRPQSGVPGPTHGRTYARLLSRVLWQQRLSTLQGARAALEVERIARDHVVARRAAIEDPLTGVGNRRALDEALRSVQAEAAISADVPVSLLVVDLNDFKRINDTYGHVVGDEVLRAVAMAIRGVARSDDVVARLGGDEFVVLARRADTATGARLAERVTAAIDGLSVGTRTGAVTLRASVGVATAGSGHGVGRLLAEADASMYGVKARARRR